MSDYCYDVQQADQVLGGSRDNIIARSGHPHFHSLHARARPSVPYSCLWCTVSRSRFKLRIDLSAATQVVRTLKPDREAVHVQQHIWMSGYTITTTSTMDPDGPVTTTPASPPVWRWVLSFLAVGACWGLTTPFMRRAAVIRDQQPKQQRPYLTSDAPWVKRKLWGILYAVMDLLRNPAYAIPLLLNVTGSVSSTLALLSCVNQG